MVMLGLLVSKNLLDDLIQLKGIVFRSQLVAIILSFSIIVVGHTLL